MHVDFCKSVRQGLIPLYNPVGVGIVVAITQDCAALVLGFGIKPRWGLLLLLRRFFDHRLREPRAAQTGARLMFRERDKKASLPCVAGRRHSCPLLTRPVQPILFSSGPCITANLVDLKSGVRFFYLRFSIPDHLRRISRQRA